MPRQFVRPLLLALTLVLTLGGALAAPLAAQDASPVTGPISQIELAPGFVAEVLAASPSVRASGQTVYLARFFIEPGAEINYDYGTDYFKIFLKPIGCKCDHCEKKRAKKRAEARAEKKRLKLKAEKKAARQAEKAGKKAPVSRRKSGAKPAAAVKSANAHARGSGKPTRTKAARTKPLSSRAGSPVPANRASAT